MPHFGKWVCPACAQGVKRAGVEEELARRRGLLAKLEAAEPYPGLEALKRETRNGIERLERRMNERERSAAERKA